MTAASGIANSIAGNTLKVPYRVPTPRVKKLPATTKPTIKKKHAITASHMKSNHDLQLPTHGIERSLYGITGGGTTGGGNDSNGDDSDGDGDVMVLKLILQNDMLFYKQHKIICRHYCLIKLLISKIIKKR
jgi:hypothetical protein